MEPLSLLLTSTYHGRYLTHVLQLTSALQEKKIARLPSCIPLFPHTRIVLTGANVPFFLPLIVQHGCSVCVWLLRLRKNIEVVHAYCIDGSIRSTRISIQKQNTKEKMLTCVGWCCTFILPFNALSDQLATSLVPILASSFAYFYILHRFLLQLASGYNFSIQRHNYEGFATFLRLYVSPLSISFFLLSPPMSLQTFLSIWGGGFGQPLRRILLHTYTHRHTFTLVFDKWRK